MRTLELLAPARNLEIGIAAIDCGADAVYIAGPGFGARQAAGNSLEDIASLCSYAHRFGARIFLTVNTIVYDDELDEVHTLMRDAQAAGVDAFIVQDLALTQWDDITVPLHASTQCAIRTPEKARWLESLGFGRLVLERELSLEQVRAISEAVSCEIEAFVHGALCVCYSGQCYLSEHIAGRSANRGACIQACRSLYDLVDGEGNVLVRDKALLSLKDYHLLERLPDLAEAGVCSFKIEGRLKNLSYVRNVVRAYSLALDRLVAAYPDRYRRASFGAVSGGFTPSLDKTFNRGYTTLYIDGKRDRWSSMDTPKSVGERVGTVAAVRRIDARTMEIVVRTSRKGLTLNNGDGFSVPGKGGIIGFRGDVCEGLTIRCKPTPGVVKGADLYRNIDAAFERELERSTCKRELRVDLDLRISGHFSLDFTARSEDGREVFSPFKADLDTAENRERAEAIIREQLSKRSGDFIFRVRTLEVSTPGGALPLMSASTLNSIRRLIASDLEAQPCGRLPLNPGRRISSPETGSPLPEPSECHPERSEGSPSFPEELTYKANVANRLAATLIPGADPAYELAHPADAELMRTRYCIKYELALCPVHQGAKPAGPLFLLNNGRRLALGFDCARCEMTVVAAK